MQRKVYATTLGILAAATARVSFGQTAPYPVYDPINYATGPLANVGNGSWTIGDTAVGSIGVDGSGLNDPATYTGLNPSKPGSVAINNVPTVAQVSKLAVPFVAAPTSGTNEVYYSLTMRVSQISTELAINPTGNGTFFAGLNNSIAAGSGASAGNAFLRIRRTAANTFQLGICMDTGSTTPTSTVWDTTDNFTVDETTQSNNPTIMVVGRYNMGTATTNSSADMWVNPTASTFGLSETGLGASGLLDTHSANLGTNNLESTVQDFFLRKNIGASVGTPTSYIDNIRVGTTWASVAPSVWQGTNSTYSSSSNWYTGSVPSGKTMVPTFADISGASHAVNLGSGITLGGLIFNSPAGYTLSTTSGALTLDSDDKYLSNGSQDPTGTKTVQIKSSLGSHTIAAPVVLNQNLTADVEAGSVTFTNGISSAASTTTGLTVTGLSSSAPLILSGVASTYTGTTTLGTGGLLRAHQAVLPNTNLVLNGGVYEPTDTSFTQTLGTGAGQVQIPGAAGNVASGASGFSAFGGPLTVNLNNGGQPIKWGDTSASTQLFNPAILVLNAQTADNSLLFQNDIDLNSANIRTISVNGGSATMSGAITNTGGVGGLSKTSTGILVLTNTNNSYSGQTQISGGVLRGVDGTNVPNVSSNPSNTSIITLNGGVYEPTTSTWTRPLGSTANGQVRFTSGTGGFSAFGQDLSVTITVGSTTPVNTLQWNVGDFVLTGLVLNSADATNNITLNNNLDLDTAATTLSRTVQVNAQTATINGTIFNSNTSSIATLVKTGAGTLELSQNNTFNGGVKVSGGILEIDSDGALGVVPASPSATNITLDGGTLRYNNPSIHLENNRGITITANGGTIDTAQYTEPGWGPTSGFGVNGGPLTKTGSGQFQYSGGNQNSYSALTLQGGTFSIVKADELPSGAITFNGGALAVSAGYNTGNPVVVSAGGGTFNTGGNDVTDNGAYSGTGGTLHKAGTSHLITNGVQIGGLSVDAGTVTVASGRSTAKLSKLATLSVAGSAAMDLNDNDLIIDYSGGTSPAQLTAAQTLIKRGFANGAWTGDGLTSSLAKAAATSGHQTALGFAEASTVQSVGSTFDGVTTDSDMILVRYTYSGDANLDGTVNSSDFGLLAANFGATGKFWANGDYNYDGTVNALDFNALATNYGQVEASAIPDGALAAGIGALVPEPGSIALLGSAAMLLASRRRRSIA